MKDRVLMLSVLLITVGSVGLNSQPGFPSPKAAAYPVAPQIEETIKPWTKQPVLIQSQAGWRSPRRIGGGSR